MMIQIKPSMARQHDFKRSGQAFFFSQEPHHRAARNIVAAGLFAVPVGTGVAVAGRAIMQPARLYSTYKHAAGISATLLQIAAVMPALGPNLKVGMRFGTEPETRPLIEMSPLLAWYVPDYMQYTPIPVPDFGLTAVPNDSSRWIYETNKSSIQSRGGEHTSRSGTPSAGLSTPGPSAQIKPRASRKKPRGMISRANRRGAPTSGRRRPRTVRYRKGGCPPGYRYDRRRKMCVLT